LGGPFAKSRKSQGLGSKKGVPKDMKLGEGGWRRRIEREDRKSGRGEENPLKRETTTRKGDGGENILKRARGT